jgi:hypothetical protein
MRRSPTMDSFYRFYKGRQVTRCVMAAVALMALVAASYSPPPRSVNPVERRGREELESGLEEALASGSSA